MWKSQRTKGNFREVDACSKECINKLSGIFVGYFIGFEKCMLKK